MEEIADFFHQIKQKHKVAPVYLGGDFNSFDPSLAILSHADMKILTSNPTRGTRILDYIITDAESNAAARVLEPLVRCCTGMGAFMEYLRTHTDIHKPPTACILAISQ